MQQEYSKPPILPIPYFRWVISTVSLPEVGFILRKAGAHATTTIEIASNNEGIRWQYKIAFKSGDLKFNFGNVFDETTPDGRTVKVCKGI